MHLEKELTEDELISLRNLPQYTDKTDEEIRAIFRRKRKKFIPEGMDILDTFSDPKEKKIALNLLEKYLKDYSIETISDKNSLKQLIDLEIIHRRLREVLEKTHKDDTAIPLNLVDSIHKNLNQIITVKDSLGISKSAAKDQQKDAYDMIDTLKRKFKKWREENQGSRRAICPYCSQMILFRIRTDKYDLVKHPFFKDRVLYSKHLVELYKLGKIGKEDVAKVLEVSEDYIDWLLEKIDK